MDLIGIVMAHDQAHGERHQDHQPQQAAFHDPDALPGGPVDFRLVHLGHQEPGGSGHLAQDRQHRHTPIVPPLDGALLPFGRQRAGHVRMGLHGHPEFEGRARPVAHVVEEDHLVPIPSEELGLSAGTGSWPGLDQGIEELPRIQHEQKQAPGGSTRHGIDADRYPYGQVGGSRTGVPVEILDQDVPRPERLLDPGRIQRPRFESGGFIHRGDRQSRVPLGIHQDHSPVGPVPQALQPSHHLRLRWGPGTAGQEPGELDLDQAPTEDLLCILAPLLVPLRDLADLQVPHRSQLPLGPLPR